MKLLKSIGMGIILTIIVFFALLFSIMMSDPIPEKVIKLSLLTVPIITFLIGSVSYYFFREK